MKLSRDSRSARVQHHLVTTLLTSSLMAGTCAADPRLPVGPVGNAALFDPVTIDADSDGFGNAVAAGDFGADVVERGPRASRVGPRGRAMSEVRGIGEVGVDAVVQVGGLPPARTLTPTHHRTWTLPRPPRDTGDPRLDLAHRSGAAQARDGHCREAC